MTEYYDNNTSNFTLFTAGESPLSSTGTSSPSYFLYYNDSNSISYIDDESINFDDDNYYDDGNATIYSKIAALIWLLTFLFWIYAQTKQEEERERMEQEDIVRREEERKTQLMLDPQNRNIVINDTMLKMVMYEEQLRGLENSVVGIDVHQGDDDDDSSSTQQKQHHPAECPICLERFEPGDELSWSKELKCHHIFHSDCLQPWLMNNDECPCCRTTFFDLNDFEKRGLMVMNEKSESNDNDDEDDGNVDNLSGSNSERRGRFAVVNGLISIVRQLSGSESNRLGLNLSSRSHSSRRNRDSLSMSESTTRRRGISAVSPSSPLSRFRKRDGLSLSDSSTTSYRRGISFAFGNTIAVNNGGIDSADAAASEHKISTSSTTSTSPHQSFDESSSLEMVPMSKRSKSNTAMMDEEISNGCIPVTNITSRNNDRRGGSNNNKKKKRKKNKKRYNALANDSDDSDSDDYFDDHDEKIKNEGIDNNDIV